MAADQRPKPQYGEYADESATPETASTGPLSGAPANGAAASGTAASGTAAGDAPASSEASGLSLPAETAVPAHTAALSASAAPTAPATTGSAGANTPLPGVPHNLGVTPRPGAASPAGTTAGTAGSAAGPAASTTGTPTQPNDQHGAPYVAPPPPGAVQAPPAASAANQAAQPQPLEAQTRKRSPADRIITLILLGIGALGALNIAAGLYELPANLRMIGEMLGASELEVPDAVATAGVIGAISVLTLYALTLIYSIQRLRGGKLTFWVPLTAGVVATLINAGFLYFAVTQMPELFALLSDPAAFEALLGQAA